MGNADHQTSLGGLRIGGAHTPQPDDLFLCEEDDAALEGEDGREEGDDEVSAAPYLIWEVAEGPLQADEDWALKALLCSILAHVGAQTQTLGARFFCGRAGIRRKAISATAASGSLLLEVIDLAQFWLNSSGSWEDTIRLVRTKRRVRSFLQQGGTIVGPWMYTVLQVKTGDSALALAATLKILEALRELSVNSIEARWAIFDLLIVAKYLQSGSLVLDDLCKAALCSEVAEYDVYGRELLSFIYRVRPFTLTRLKISRNNREFNPFLSPISESATLSEIHQHILMLCLYGKDWSLWEATKKAWQAGSDPVMLSSMVYWAAIFDLELDDTTPQPMSVLEERIFRELGLVW